MKTIYKKIISILLIVIVIFQPVSIAYAAKMQRNQVDTGNLIGNALMGAMIGYLTCYASGVTWSWMSQGVDMLSVPTNAIGGKMIDNSVVAKECGFDYAAQFMKKELIKGIIESTTEWVKGGFDEAPSFISHPDQFLFGAYDKYIGKVLEQNEWAKGLCQGQEIPLKLAVNLEFNSRKKRLKNDEINAPTCTLTKFKENVAQSLGDLKNYYSSDGTINPSSWWSQFVTFNENPNNTAAGAYITLSDDLNRLIGEENRKRLEDVNRNGGFMSIERCVDKDTGEYSYGSGDSVCSSELEDCLAKAETDSEKELCHSEANRCYTNAKKGKQKCEYVTPGRVVSDYVSKTVGMEDENLLLADEFDELIAALITKLVSSVFDSDEGLASYDASQDFAQNDHEDMSGEKKIVSKLYCEDAYDAEIEMYQKVIDGLKYNNEFFFDAVISGWNNRLVNRTEERWRYEDKKGNVIRNAWEITNTEEYDPSREGVVNKITGEGVLYKEIYLTKETIYDNVSAIKRIEKKYDKKIQEFEKKLEEKKKTIPLIKDKVKELEKVRTRKELWNLFVDENGKQLPTADIDSLYQEIKQLNNEIDRDINGVQSYSSKGRTGGLLVSVDYLESFRYKNKTAVIQEKENSKMWADLKKESTDKKEDWTIRTEYDWNEKKENNVPNGPHFDPEALVDSIKDKCDFDFSDNNGTFDFESKNERDNKTDTDGDEVPDYYEWKTDTDYKNKDSYKDSDKDGVPDYIETDVDGTDPNDKAKYKDTDGDEVPDYIERHSNPSTDTEDKTKFKDSDGDGVPDYVEKYKDGTDSDDKTKFKDSDGDGYSDYYEKLKETDPNDPNSKPE